MEPNDDEIRDWQEQVRLNTLVYEYAREKLKEPAFSSDREDSDELNAKVRHHYARLAEESKELSDLFQKILADAKESV
jgi:hypothetical protein